MLCAAQPAMLMLDVASQPVVPLRGKPLSHYEQQQRNPGVPLDLSWLDGLRVNQSAVARRVSTLGTRRAVKKDAQAAWLLKAITCIDLTTLNGDDTAARVERLCAKARRPIRDDLLESLGMPPGSIKTGAVCVYHRFVGTAVAALAGSGIPVAAVSTGFPAGLIPHPLDRKSTRLNSSHITISYAVFCLKKKKTIYRIVRLLGKKKRETKLYNLY